MAVTVYDSVRLATRIDELASDAVGRAYFRDRFFGGTPIFSTTKKIMFDVVDKARRLAPYVSPVFQGKVMEHRGIATRIFEPPYLKPKGVVDPAKHLQQRMPGEQPFGGGLSLEQRRAMLVDELLADQEMAVTAREEIQAVEALRLGQVTVSGDGYGTLVLSYGRDAALTIVLAGAAKWDQSGVDVLANLETWAALVFTKSGASPREVYFGTTAWASFATRLTTAQKDLLFDNLRASASRAELGPRAPDYVRARGTWGDFDLFEVSEKYQDDDGTEVALLPATEVVMASASGLEGRMAYGAILDPRAGYASVRAFPKNWIEEDPAMEFVMTQSAPLAVPLRPNASLGVVVQ